MIIETLKLWEDRDDVELTTFLYTRDKFLESMGKPAIKRPAVVVCPGGAYQNCPRHGNEGDPVAMTFAADGFNAFVLEYSVAEKAPQERTLFPAQVIDLGKAILTIREHADEWGVDTEKIAICGFSAGGHLCSMYATTWHTDLLSGHFGCDKENFRIMAAIPIYGLHDYVYQEEFNRSHPSMFTEQDINSPVFGCREPGNDILEKFSPVRLASKDTPPMFMAAATDDGLVPAMHTLRMATRLQELGVPYECHMFQYGEHGFALGRNIFEPYRQDMAHACAQWVPLAKTFLMHLISPDSLKPEENPFKDMPF